MTISEVDVVPLASEVEISEDELTVSLADGRRLSVPLAWFPRLLNATSDERGEFRLIGGGEGIHWPRINEDISVAGLLRGSRSHTQPSMGEYRQAERADTWHWCTSCSSYPTSNYFVRRSRPATGMLCNECQAKTNAGRC